MKFLSNNKVGIIGTNIGLLILFLLTPQVPYQVKFTVEIIGWYIFLLSLLQLVWITQNRKLTAIAIIIGGGTLYIALGISFSYIPVPNLFEFIFRAPASLTLIIGSILSMKRKKK